MKSLVTGGAGFIGFHTSKYLLNRGDVVIGIDNLNDYYDPALKKARLSLLKNSDKFTFHKIDIVDKNSVDNIFLNDQGYTSVKYE